MRLVCLFFLFLSLPACVGHEKEISCPAVWSGKIAPPSDFSVQCLIVSRLDQENPQTQTSRYLLKADRSLAIAVGRAAMTQTHPEIFRKISWAQYCQVFQIVDLNLLVSEPSTLSSVTPSDATPLIYRITIMSNNSTHEYITTPEASPATHFLLQTLIDARILNSEHLR